MPHEPIFKLRYPQLFHVQHLNCTASPASCLQSPFHFLLNFKSLRVLRFHQISINVDESYLLVTILSQLSSCLQELVFDASCSITPTSQEIIFEALAKQQALKSIGFPPTPSEEAIQLFQQTLVNQIETVYLFGNDETSIIKELKNSKVLKNLYLCSSLSSCRRELVELIKTQCKTLEKIVIKTIEDKDYLTVIVKLVTRTIDKPIQVIY